MKRFQQQSLSCLEQPQLFTLALHSGLSLFHPFHQVPMAGAPGSTRLTVMPDSTSPFISPRLQACTKMGD